jgi:hypothetical protein
MLLIAFIDSQRIAEPSKSIAVLQYRQKIFFKNRGKYVGNDI